jgi:hypothetical protein
MTTPTTLVIYHDDTPEFAREFATRAEAESAVLEVMHRVAPAYSCDHAFKHEGWRAEFLTRDTYRPYGDEWEVDAWRKHHDKFEALAQRIGIAFLERMVPASKATIIRALASGDYALNKIPLASWDARDSQVRRSGMSLSDTVCVLKHVAKFYVAGGAYHRR